MRLYSGKGQAIELQISLDEVGGFYKEDLEGSYWDNEKEIIFTYTIDGYFSSKRQEFEIDSIDITEATSFDDEGNEIMLSESERDELAEKIKPHFEIEELGAPIRIINKYSQAFI